MEGCLGLAESAWTMASANPLVQLWSCASRSGLLTFRWWLVHGHEGRRRGLGLDEYGAGDDGSSMFASGDKEDGRGGSAQTSNTNDDCERTDPSR
ncbi:hypothetical protein NL676_006942 [Syzygium grande]|nr:hypothetical protein NL676_006942 [Syzygium grande]